eukprot:CAMPEP_0183802512 /NCGR_PEP_ID=MMETSP0803_2-20130417/30593_1 /TAXON_ID=195967 /ORGANISM="Crustomastix stigmata, Strain CCMP3273" /LENGTH=83 /DNA_ID=CAMNT_0026047243 /DNA_START=28 /DNA_END=275 /DNA_ORIENTATION=-
MATVVAAGWRVTLKSELQLVVASLLRLLEVWGSCGEQSLRESAMVGILRVLVALRAHAEDVEDVEGAEEGSDEDDDGDDDGDG